MTRAENGEDIADVFSPGGSSSIGSRPRRCAMPRASILNTRRYVQVTLRPEGKK
jgi:hypothetical protein